MKPIISKNSRIRHPELFTMGDYSILDDYCYISARVQTGKFYHIAANCVIAGGKEELFKAGNYGGLAAGCKIFCASDDFKHDIGSVLHEFTYVKDNIIRGGVTTGDFVTLGAGTVVMPNNNIPEGVCIGANCFVPPKFKFEPWSIYAMGLKQNKMTQTYSYKLIKVSNRDKCNVQRQATLIEKELNEK